MDSASAKDPKSKYAIKDHVDDSKVTEYAAVEKYFYENNLNTCRRSDNFPGNF